MVNTQTILIRLLIIGMLIFSAGQLSAYPGRGEDHSQEHDQGNAPGDPGGGGAPVGPVDGGILILVAGAAGYFTFKKKKNY